MSAEAEVSEALDQPVDQNAQSAEDVKKMLAELEGEAQTKTEADSTAKEEDDAKPNGTSNGSKDEALEESRHEKDVEISAHNRRDQRDGHDRKRHDRHDRGGRGGRGGSRGGRKSFKDNIKSDVTTQEESNDPVAIRKQVRTRTTVTLTVADSCETG